MTEVAFHQYMLPITKKIYSMHSYTGISYDEIVKFITIKFKQDKERCLELSREGLYQYFSYETKKFMRFYLEGKFNDQGTMVTIIDNYINERLRVGSDYHKNVKQLEKLMEFFNSINYQPTADVIIGLIEKNDILKNILDSISNRNANAIFEGNIKEVFKNDVIVCFLEAYSDFLESVNNKNNALEYNLKVMLDDKANDSDLFDMYLKELNMPLLTALEEKKLVLRIEQGDLEARDQLIQSNLRLVIKVAVKYSNRGLDLIDLVQEGNIGLMKAADNFDSSRGLRFSTYAMHWIRQGISRATREQSRTIRVPSYMHDKLAVYSKTAVELEKTLLREPTMLEVATKMGIPIETVSRYEQIYEGSMSLNETVGEEEDSELEDFIPSEDATPEDITISNDLSSNVQKLLNSGILKPTEMQILALRYGLNNNEVKTLEEVGALFGVSRERIRQIETRAISKLRLSSNIKKYAIYMDAPDKAMDNIMTYRELYADDVRNKNKMLEFNEGVKVLKKVRRKK